MLGETDAQHAPELIVGGDSVEQRPQVIGALAVLEIPLRLQIECLDLF